MAGTSYWIERVRAGEVLVLRVGGKLDQEAGAAIVAALEGHAGPAVLNLAGVDYLASTGIAFLAKLSASRGVRIASPSDCVHYTLDLAGIKPILAIDEDEATACGTF